MLVLGGMKNAPKTLQEAIRYFADPENCVNYIVARRWPNGVVCPTCGSENVSFVPSRRVWQCKTRHPKCQFSVKVGTIFEDSAIALDKWLTAMWMLANCKNSVSSYEIGRDLGITQKSAWFMLQRIRLALQSYFRWQGRRPRRGSRSGRNFHRQQGPEDVSRRKRRLAVTGVGGKAPIVGILERRGELRANVIPTSTQA